MLHLILALHAACAQPNVSATVTPRFTDVTATNLPAGILTARSMDARPADIDGDGDLDLIIAQEFSTNHILINDGAGAFTDGAPTLLPQPQPVFDSEDVAVADFDADGHLDILFVSEDNQTNEFYLWDADLSRYVLTNLGVTGISNACLAADVDSDGDMDILIGNAGPNYLLINDGDGTFANESVARLGLASNTTQDLEMGDIDGDGDDDLVVGNEQNNQIYINDGNGFFTNETQARLGFLVPGQEMTREADLGDVDGDGDLDLLFANVMFQGGNNPQDRLLINDGTGVFTDETQARLPASARNSIDGDLVDIDGDGDLDILLGYFMAGGADVLQNDGTGVFKLRTPVYIPFVTGDTIDFEAMDVNGDGVLDLYLCHYLAGDRLMLGKP